MSVRKSNFVQDFPMQNSISTVDQPLRADTAMESIEMKYGSATKLSNGYCSPVHCTPVESIRERDLSTIGGGLTIASQINQTIIATQPKHPTHTSVPQFSL